MACSDDDSVKDPIYEFISFKNETVTINENTGSVTPLPVVLNLLGYVPDKAITVNLSVANNNVEEGVDYELSAKTVVFQPGSLVSDTLFVKTIDNNTGTTEERSLELNIVSVSEPDIKIGLGLEAPVKSVLKVIIADDECTETTEVFDSETLINTTTYDTSTITGTLNGSTLKLQGDLISYSPFANAMLEVVLTHEGEGATKGSVTFDDYNAGTDSDGYEYQFRQVGDGTYDTCSGELIVSFEIYYDVGGMWIYWYTSYNTITLTP